jgi:cold shock CspA family protein
MTTASGVVVAFDEHAGHGIVRTAEGGDHFFHCTAIGDGSRTIAVGTAVTFRIVPGHHGRWEATDLVPVSPAPEDAHGQ